MPSALMIIIICYCVVCVSIYTFKSSVKSTYLKTTSMVAGNREMWETSVKGLQSLIRRTTPSSFAYICEKTGNVLSDKVVLE